MSLGKGPSAPASTGRLRRFGRALEAFVSRGKAKKVGHPVAPGSTVPTVLPRPSAFVPKALGRGMDLWGGGTRLRINVKVEQPNPTADTTVTAILSIVPAPQRRIRDATLTLEFGNDIVELFPKHEDTNETEVRRNNAVANNLFVRGSGRREPVGLPKALGFARRVWGIIRGDIGC